MIKKIFLCVILLCIISAISIYIAKSKHTENELNNKANSILYDISNLMEILNTISMKNDDKTDNILKEKIENILINKIIIIGTIKPKITTLKGVPFKALREVIEYEERIKQSPSLNSELKKAVIYYLNTIKKDFSKEEVIRKSKRKNIFK